MRKNRELKSRATYHISSKINRSEKIFSHKRFKKLFLETVKRAKEKYKFKMYNFTIMDNHIHFLLKPEENENLSRIMQWILSVFAINYNRINKIKGHVWQGRFFSSIINSYIHFIDVFKYISNNPVKAQIVNNPLDYQYNGITFCENKNFEIIDRLSNIFVKYLFK